MWVALSSTANFDIIEPVIIIFKAQRQYYYGTSICVLGDAWCFLMAWVYYALFCIYNPLNLVWFLINLFQDQLAWLPVPPEPISNCPERRNVWLVTQQLIHNPNPVHVSVKTR